MGGYGGIVIFKDKDIQRQKHKTKLYFWQREVMVLILDTEFMCQNTAERLV